MYTITLLDGYIDEPTCLGVPPYISPYPRYIAGGIVDTIPEVYLSYFTIDQYREKPNLINTFNKSDVFIIIAGMAVPGKYLAGYPASHQEIKRILQSLHKPHTFLCGPAARYGFGVAGGKQTYLLDQVSLYLDGIIKGDAEIVIVKLLEHDFDVNAVDLSTKRPSAASIGLYAIKGSAIVSQHPYYPTRLLAEIETYRGCPRSLTGGCSFCSEPSKGPPDFRPIDDIVKEIYTLYQLGVRHFRLGNQPCLFTYQSKDARKKEIPRPNPRAIETLFSQIRYYSPDIKTLHIDNVNPGVVAMYPDESSRVINTIIRYHTSGDVAAFGVESVDPVVIEKNNLKASKDDIIKAITLFNTFGGKRGENGMPELLPGINFVFGLDGETAKTYEHDLKFLKSLLKKDLFVRRINLRQLIPLPGTKIAQHGNRTMRKHLSLFHKFKYQVQQLIEKPMLERIVPRGTILTDVIGELWKGKTMFARQLGSYPLLVGIPGQFPLFKPLDVIVIDHGYRSVTAIPFPLAINTSPRETIEQLPGIGKKRAIRLLRHRPFTSSQQIKEALDDDSIATAILPYLKI